MKNTVLRAIIYEKNSHVFCAMRKAAVQYRISATEKRGYGKMIVRKLTENDIGRCLEIYNYYIEETTVSFEEEPLAYDAFAARVGRISASYPFVVAEEDGVVVGYAYLDRFHERSAYRFTADLSIYLDKNCLARGTGGMLLEETEKLGAEMGITNIISLVTGENARSVAFHEKHGFKQVGCLEKVGVKFGKVLDVFYFQKSIG